MRQALTQPRASAIPLSDSGGSFNRRKRNSLYVTVTLLIVSLLILTVGLAATTRTQNVTVGGYYPGVILGFGSFLGIIGSNLIENKRQMKEEPRIQTMSSTAMGQERLLHIQTSTLPKHTVSFCWIFLDASRFGEDPVLAEKWGTSITNEGIATQLLSSVL